MSIRHTKPALHSSCGLCRALQIYLQRPCLLPRALRPPSRVGISGAEATATKASGDTQEAQVCHWRSGPPCDSLAMKWAIITHPPSKAASSRHRKGQLLSLRKARQGQLPSQAEVATVAKERQALVT